MADDIPQDPQLAATARLIVEKRDQLLAERTELREAREALLARSRRVDREIGDCRAAARFFGLNLDFPEDPHDIAEREALMMRRMREQELAAREATRAAQRNLFNEARHPPGAGRPAAPIPPVPVPAPALPAHPLPPPPPFPPPPLPPFPSVTPAPPLPYPPVPLGNPARPTVREVALLRLREAGGKGAKAADIRDYFERTYGQVVHEKTVGMTLYRLLQANQAHREGHTWFFGPPNAETKNPGGETPGLRETGN